jgi:hypothetical protein
MTGTISPQTQALPFQAAGAPQGTIGFGPQSAIMGGPYNAPANFPASPVDTAAAIQGGAYLGGAPGGGQAIAAGAGPASYQAASSDPLGIDNPDSMYNRQALNEAALGPASGPAVSANTIPGAAAPVSATLAPTPASTASPAAAAAEAAPSNAASQAAANVTAQNAGGQHPAIGQIGQSLASMGFPQAIIGMIGQLFSMLSGHENPTQFLQNILGMFGGQQQGQQQQGGRVMPGQTFTVNGKTYTNLGHGRVRDENGNILTLQQLQQIIAQGRSQGRSQRPNTRTPTNASNTDGTDTTDTSTDQYGVGPGAAPGSAVT